MQQGGGRRSARHVAPARAIVRIKAVALSRALNPPVSYYPTMELARGAKVLPPRSLTESSDTAPATPDFGHPDNRWMTTGNYMHWVAAARAVSRRDCARSACHWLCPPYQQPRTP
jgi:hypothetical protein